MSDPNKPLQQCHAACAEIDRLVEQIASGKDPRARIKQARRLGFLAQEISRAAALNASSWLDGQMTPAHLDPMIESAMAAFRLADSKGGAPDPGTLAMLAMARLAMAKKEAAVLAESTKVAAVETASLIATASYAFDPGVYFNDDSRHGGMLAAMNRGELFLVKLGGDGDYEVTLRIIAAPEPVLRDENELARVIVATTPGFLRIEGPLLVCGPPEDIMLGPALRAPQGLMKIQAFALEPPEDADDDGLVAFRLLLVACPIQTPPEAIAQIPEIRLIPFEM